MKSTLFVRILLLSGLTAFGSAASVTASASDEFAGALIGAGAGAVIGNSINHREGAVVGGIFGAILGAAIADNDHDRDRDRDHHVVRDRYYQAPVYRHPVDVRPYYPQVPLVSYPAPRVHVVTQPVYVDVRPSHHWRYDRDGRRDDRRWDRDHDRRHDGRGDRSRW